MEAITFLCICMSLATSGFIHLLRAEHAGRVYSSSHMKINCAATHLSPNVAAYTSEVTLLHQHRPAWAGQRNMNHCRWRDAQKNKKTAVPLICSCCLLWVVLFRCVWGALELRWDYTGQIIHPTPWCHSTHSQLPQPHGMPIKPELLILKKSFFINYNLKKHYQKIKKGMKPIARISYCTPLSAPYSFFPSFPKRPLVIITPKHWVHIRNQIPWDTADLLQCSPTCPCSPPLRTNVLTTIS